MDNITVIDAFAALSQSTRLAAFRLLTRHEPEGLPAGEIACLLDVPHNTMSTHLGVLSRAGLVVSRRHSRSMIYRANLAHMREMLSFLVRDCCAGHPELCEPLIRELRPCCPTDAQPTRERPIMTSVIYHNPDCGTSRNTLAMMRQSREEPHVIEYLKTPPTREKLVELLTAMAITPRELLRRKGTPYDELGLDDPELSDDQLIDAMLAHPILINRPIVVTEKGARLCRPSETVLPLLAHPIAEFTKEDGEVVRIGEPDA